MLTDADFEQPQEPEDDELDTIAGGGDCICSFAGGGKVGEGEEPAPALWAEAVNIKTAVYAASVLSAVMGTGKRFLCETEKTWRHFPLQKGRSLCLKNDGGCVSLLQR